MNKMNKKGFALALIAIILALMLLTVYLVSLATRNCNSNKDCPQNAYCGTDYECHEYPKEIVIQNNNFFPAMIIGVSIIIAAFIFRRKNTKTEKATKEETEKEIKEQ